MASAHEHGAPSAVAALAAALIRMGGAGHVSVDVTRGQLTVHRPVGSVGAATVVCLSSAEADWVKGAASLPAPPLASSNDEATVDVKASLKTRPDLTFDEIYETVKVLGSGATAEVRLVRHRATGDEVAAKFVRVTRDMKDDVDSSCRDVPARVQPTRLRQGMRVWAPARAFADLSKAAAAALGGAAGDVPLTAMVAYVGDAPRGAAYKLGSNAAGSSESPWLGVVLDLPLGSHEGVVSGKSFFAAPSGHGAFLAADVCTMVHPSVVATMSPLRHGHILQLQDWRAPKQCYRKSPDSGETVEIDWAHPVYESDGGNTMILVLDACRGGDLAHSLEGLAGQGQVSERVIALIMRNVLLAVQYMHEKGLIHHDLKVDNVLLSKPLPDNLDEYEGLSDVLAQHIKVCDFDISKHESDGDIHGGTPGYIAPELFAVLNHADTWGDDWRAHLMSFGIDLSAQPSYDTKIDVYALGVMLYRLLGGGDAPNATINYFDFDDWDDANKDALKSLLQPPCFGGSFGGVSQTARDLVTEMMAPDPKIRPSCAAALTHEWFGMHATECITSLSAQLAFKKPAKTCRPQKGADFEKTKFGLKACRMLQDVAAEKGSAHVVLPSSMTSFQRLRMHAYAATLGLKTKSFDSAGGRRRLVAWRYPNDAGGGEPSSEVEEPTDAELEALVKEMDAAEQAQREKGSQTSV